MIQPYPSQLFQKTQVFLFAYSSLLTLAFFLIFAYCKAIFSSGICTCSPSHRNTLQKAVKELVLKDFLDLFPSVTFLTTLSNK
jgi:hypothetical protein